MQVGPFLLEKSNNRLGFVLIYTEIVIFTHRLR